MGLFDVFKNLGDPTRDWPLVQGGTPAIDHGMMELEAPRFGGPLQSARVLGRPDRFIGGNRKGGNCELLYARKGLRVEFELHRLVGLTFYISPESLSQEGFKPAAVTAQDGTPLNPGMRKARLIELFGEPDVDGSSEDVIQIRHGRTASEFFLSEKGTLDYWELFLND